MTERGLPGADVAPACPFVAFEDDRSSRSASPDHRHRCYAEPVPSPRAAAHQEAYCLSSAFPVCPTFQDWARREAAHARGEGEQPHSAPSAIAAAAAPGGSLEADDAEEDEPWRHDVDRDDEPPIHRNPPRDWAAPPPWASAGPAGAASAARRSTSSSGGGTGNDRDALDFLADQARESQGLAGSAADRLAAGDTVGHPDARRARSSRDPVASVAPDQELASLVGVRRVVERPAVPGHPPVTRTGRGPSVSSTRPTPREPGEGPSWERARRYEAYPTIRTRVGLPTPPRLAVVAGALAIAALALFFLPALLGVGGGGGGGGGGGDTATPSPGAGQGVATSSPEPTASAAPTGQTYVIKSGDTLSKIASSFGLTPEELLAANKDTLTNPDKIFPGDEIVIPTKPPDEFTQPSIVSPAAS